MLLREAATAIPNSCQGRARTSWPPEAPLATLRPVLIGRDKEVGSVLEVVARRRCCTLVGEPGIGKTAVLEAVHAELGDRAALGGAIQPLRWVPYFALQRACDVDLAGSPDHVLPVVLAALDGRALLLDDLHWADPDTIELLPELAHEVSIVAAVRAGDQGSESALAIVAALGTLVSVEPLEPDAAHALARDSAPSATEAELREVVEASGGNPLLLTCGSNGGATPADRRVVALVARASERARYALACFALHGRPARAPSGPELEELERLGLLVLDDDGRWRVRHDTFGQAALQLVSPAERRSLHRLLAERTNNDGERARHYLHSGQPDRARECALRAAEAATSPHERADHLAIATMPVDGVADPDLMLDTADALAVSGRVEEGLVYAKFADAKTREQLLRRHKTIAWCALWAAQYDVVWPALEAAVEMLTPADGETEVVVRLLRARYLARVAWDAEAAIAEARRAAAIAEREGLRVAEAYGALGSACLVNQDPAWEQWLAKSLAAARHEGTTPAEITSADTLFMAQLLAGEPADCVPLASQMIDRARTLGSRTGEAQFRKNLLLARFHVDDALDESLAAARHLLAQPLNPRQRDHVEAHLVLACADLGLDDEIPAILAGAYGFSAPDLTAKATILWAKAEADWLAGRAADAFETATECRALPVRGFPAHVLAEPIRQWAALELGIDPGPAMTGCLFANFVAANKESRAIVAMYADPSASENAGLFLSAARSWDRVSRRNAARCAWAAGEAARRAGDRERAITILRNIEPELFAGGRRPLLRRVEASLRSLGERVRSHAVPPVPPLTSSQVEVLDLVGRGLDTRAIARRLVVSEATVETHIRQAMQRLGVPTRLAAAVELVRRRDAIQPAASEEQRIVVADEEPELTPGGVSLDALPPAPWRLDRSQEAVGVVRTEDDIARAILAAARGASLLISIDPELPRPARAELLDTLARIAPIERPAPPELGGPDAELCDALRVLAAGASVTEAAKQVHMSERTLHRRLAALRSELGVKSNAAAARRVLASGG
jgi:DNA-binding NarL/FixJ family response regulator